MKEKFNKSSFKYYRPCKDAEIEVKKPANKDILSGLSEKGINEISKNWEYTFLLKIEKFDVPAYRFSLR